MWIFTPQFGLTALPLCKKLPTTTEALVIFESELQLHSDPSFDSLIENYLTLLSSNEGVEATACKISSTTDSESLKNEILGPLKSLKALTLVGSFPAPQVISRETRSYSFEFKAPDATPTYYFYADFQSYYVKGEDGVWSCQECTDFEILNRVEFPVGVIRSFRPDNLDVLNYFNRVNLFRQNGGAKHTEKLLVARSGFDGLGVLSLYDDQESASGYSQIAQSMGLEYHAPLESSRIRGVKHLNQTKVDELKTKVQTSFAEEGLVFVSIMHGNDRFAGGNSTVGPFLNSEIDQQMPGGSFFSLFHSCSTGVELSPKSLVFYDELLGSSSRLGVVAAIVDTHRMSVLPNNIIALSQGKSLGETALSLSNQIEMTFFGDPLLRLPRKQKGNSQYLDLITQTGRVFNPRTLRSFCRIDKSCESELEKLEVIAISSKRASQRANAILAIPDELLLEDKFTATMQLATQDPHPLVRQTAMSKLFSLGIEGVRIYDSHVEKIPEPIKHAIREQKNHEQEALEYPDDLSWKLN